MHEHGTVTVYWDLPGTSLLNHKGKYLKEEKRKSIYLNTRKKKSLLDKNYLHSSY